MKTFFLVIDENQKILIELVLKNMKKDAENQRRATEGLWSGPEIVSAKRITNDVERNMQLMQFETFIGELIEDVVGAEEFAGHSKDLQEEIRLTDKLYEGAMEVIKLIPECEVHGNTCLPNAKEWIMKMKGEIK